MCLYQFDDGEQCLLEDAGKGLCFWHDPTVDKKGKELGDELSQLVKSGHKMEGACLAFANLNDLDLVSRDKNIRYSLAKADLYHCQLQHAHLYNVNLSNASLMKADCTGSNFHYADLTGANLLGTKLDDAKIEHVHWGDHFYHETLGAQAKEQKDIEQANMYFSQAEEVFRNLRKTSEIHGLFDIAGHFFIKEMVVRREQLPLYSLHRFASKMVDIFCGYGERPLRVVMFSLIVILFFALMYWMVGIEGPDHFIQINSKHSIEENASELLNSVYFSVVTFTTLGYGDIVPIGVSRLLAAIEAFVGSFTIALFVVVFVKKMTR